MKKLSAKIKEATYENVFVECPYCKKENIYNRVSDLGTIMPISMDVFCEHCKKMFWMTGDLAPYARYRWFMYPLHRLKNNKSYGLYILALCQACEIFMSQAIINKLFDKNAKYRDEEGRFCEKDASGAIINVGAEAYNKVVEEFYENTLTSVVRLTDLYI